MTPLLQGEKLSRRFGGLKAVDEVDFHLDHGEILGLIGPNGAGKTTLFSVIAGSIPPSAGRVLLDGREMSRRSAHSAVHAGVCRTHQIVRPFARLSVLENVMVGAFYGGVRAKRAATMRRAHEQALELLQFVGLRERADGRPGELTLSGRKKLEVARALATKPRVLLLDEVVAGLNPVEAQKMVGLIGGVRDRGVSIIMIEHVMQAVMGLSDRVMVLDYGRKIAEGSAEEVAEDPDVIAAYFGQEAGGAGRSATKEADA
jgi:branched-chain amino acid transport system ATP-binding protein